MGAELLANPASNPDARRAARQDPAAVSAAPVDSTLALYEFSVATKNFGIAGDIFDGRRLYGYSFKKENKKFRIKVSLLIGGGRKRVTS